MIQESSSKQPLMGALRAKYGTRFGRFHATTRLLSFGD
jgi:hypothetical protein